MQVEIETARGCGREVSEPRRDTVWVWIQVRWEAIASNSSLSFSTVLLLLLLLEEDVGGKEMRGYSSNAHASIDSNSLEPTLPIVVGRNFNSAPVTDTNTLIIP